MTISSYVRIDFYSAEKKKHERTREIPIWFCGWFALVNVFQLSFFYTIWQVMILRYCTMCCISANSVVCTLNFFLLMSTVSVPCELSIYFNHKLQTLIYDLKSNICWCGVVCVRKYEYIHNCLCLIAIKIVKDKKFTKS